MRNCAEQLSCRSKSHGANNNITVYEIQVLQFATPLLPYQLFSQLSRDAECVHNKERINMEDNSVRNCVEWLPQQKPSLGNERIYMKRILLMR